MGVSIHGSEFGPKKIPPQIGMEGERQGVLGDSREGDQILPSAEREEFNQQLFRHRAEVGPEGSGSSLHGLLHVIA